jgi:hypothetical protein
MPEETHSGGPQPQQVSHSKERVVHGRDFDNVKETGDVRNESSTEPNCD